MNTAKLDEAVRMAGDANKAGRANGKETVSMARRTYQQGSIVLRGKRRKVYVLRYYQPVIRADGKLGRIRRSVVLGLASQIGTRRQARLAADNLLRSLNMGQHKPQSARTLGEFVEQDWKPAVLPTLKFSTQRQYCYLLGTHILPLFGGERLCSLAREQIQALINAKLRLGLAWETVAHIRHVLSKVLGTAVEWEALQDNPARLVKLPRREPSKQRPFLTPEQVRSLILELEEPGRTIVLLLVLAGLRIGELLALRWRDVDLEGSTLIVRETVYHGRFSAPKTASSKSALPLSREAVRALKEHRERQGNVQTDALVFPSRTRGPLDAHNLLRRVLYPACDRAKLPRVSWHSMRHTHATLLAAQGEPIKTIQSQLRHSSARLVLELYAHQIPASQRAAVERLDAQLFGPKWTQLHHKSQEKLSPVQ